MKVLILYHSPWWNATAYYGVTLAYGLQKSGHEVWFGADNGVPASKKAEEMEIRTFDLDLKTSNPLKLISEVRKLTRFVRENEIDIINTLSPQGHLFYFLADLLFGLKIPLVRSCCDVREPKSNFLNKYLYRKKADWLIFPCLSNLERYYRRLSFSKEHASVIYGAIDIKKYDSDQPEKILKEKYKIGKEEFVVGNVARLSPEKGHKHFLHVAAKVAAKIKNVKFVIVGKEEQLSIKELQDIAVTLNIGNKVIFTGFLEDTRCVADEFDIGVITSRFSETISRAALEYMTLAKPVVATDVNVLGEVIIDDLNGSIFDINDIKGMSDRIIYYIQNVDIRKNHGENGRKEAIGKYSLDKFVENTISVFEKVLSKRNSK
ncbi:glycosyltransferase family 4 protein [candidate division KSB1 bacterium]